MMHPIFQVAMNPSYLPSPKTEKMESQTWVPTEEGRSWVPDQNANESYQDCKRVLQLNGRSDLSGGPIAMLRLVQGMLEEPYQHLVVCPENSEGILEDLQKLPNAQIQTMELRRVAPSLIWKLYKLLQNIPIDLIHCHGKAAGLYGRLLGHWLGIPVLHQFHGLHYRHYFPGFKGSYLKLERFLARWSEKIICVSESECAEAEALGLFQPGQGLVIPNGVDGSQFQPNALQKQSLREDWKIPQNAWVLLAITRSSVQKDLDKTLAVHRLIRRNRPDCVLVLAGVKPEELQRLLRRKVPCDSSHVICAPPEHRMERLINVADCYLSTSRWEGFSIGLIEALAMKLPAVISRVTGNLDFIGLESEGVFLVPQGNDHAYAKRIERILDSDIRGRNARTTVLERYSQETIHQRFSEVYRELLSETHKLPEDNVQTRNQGGISTVAAL